MLAPSSLAACSPAAAAWVAVSQAKRAPTDHSSSVSWSCGARKCLRPQQRWSFAAGPVLRSPSSKGRPLRRTSLRVVQSSAEADIVAEPAKDAKKGKKGKKKSDAEERVSSRPTSGVRLVGVQKTFYKDQVLKDVNWEVLKGERVGLVGENGAGKTTQLRLIAGELELDAGEIQKCRDNMKIAYLTQEFDVTKTNTVREELVSAFGEALQSAKELERVEKELEQCGEDMEKMQSLLEELEQLQSTASSENFDQFAIDRRIDKIMPELGFTADDNDRLVASFSGGWQMRICLGKCLLQEPDLILLDEPTNHLDLDAITWLESYLKKIDVPMVIVSHDREFLDQLCNKTVETDFGVSTTYKGNYSFYLADKKRQMEEQMMKWERQQKEISELEDMVRRLSGGAQAGRAEQAKKQLESMARIEKPRTHKRIPFHFTQAERSGKKVVSIKHLTHSFGPKELFKDANLEIERGQRVAFIGPNGCGKSTILRMLMENLKPDEGSVEMGQYNILPNYFEQNQAEALDLEKTVLETLTQVTTDWKDTEIKGLLGRFMFKGEDIHKKVKVLSGGEKAKLALAKFIVTKSTLLLLDEPTNHLDIPSKELLEEALRAFEGTIVAVSHDRYFLKQIVSRVIEVKDGKLVDYDGNYDYYLQMNKEIAEKQAYREEAIEAAAPKKKAKSKMSKAEKLAAKKEKARNFSAKKAKGKIAKNAKRWN